MSKSSNKKLRLAQILMWLAAISAFLAGIDAVTGLAGTADSMAVVEVWRIIGLWTFAALFAFLAYNPRSSRILWVIVIGNKLALSIVGFFLMGNSVVVGASDLAFFDGGLTILLFVASLLADVWHTERSQR
ncbi:hypothetical protein PV379_01575 [Streptomyces caniscabiei]|uniref:hypothetical protein n=1 Tax=Streptomyces caniscabiei TaxID=2746961 RepID=UPI0029BDF875|nr:hypothetical protein [Streptomyces caniscabiei]MDX2776043.1 hypothetical protein [Streptomyces caniscabiei]